MLESLDRLPKRQRDSLYILLVVICLVGAILLYAIVTHQTCVGTTPHVVQSGETFHSIALSETEVGHYRVRDLRLPVEEMRQMNPGVSPTRLPPGKEISIPARCGDS